MRIAITINTLIRDIYRQCLKVRLITEDDFSVDDVFNPYDYLKSVSDGDDVEMFVFEHGETILGSRECLKHPKISLELTKFLHWTEEKGISVTLASTDKGVFQLFTIQLLTDLCEGQFTNFDMFDFRFCLDRAEPYDIVVHDMPSLENLGNGLILEAPHTEHMAGDKINGFDQLKEYLTWRLQDDKKKTPSKR